MSAPAARTLVAWFDDESALLGATSAARKAGLPIEDAYTPYAVHGLDEAMGLPQSRLTYVCFFAGLIGLLCMLWFETWTSAVSWPLNVGGKPANSFPAFIPVAFEFTVLCAGLGTVAALFARTGLWPGKSRPVLPRVTNDAFALALGGRRFDEAQARDLCARFGATEVRFVATTDEAGSAQPPAAKVAP